MTLLWPEREDLEAKLLETLKYRRLQFDSGECCAEDYRAALEQFTNFVLNDEQPAAPTLPLVP